MPKANKNRPSLLLPANKPPLSLSGLSLVNKEDNLPPPSNSLATEEVLSVAILFGKFESLLQAEAQFLTSIQEIIQSSPNDLNRSWHNFFTKQHKKHELNKAWVAEQPINSTETRKQITYMHQEIGDMFKFLPSWKRIKDDPTLPVSLKHPLDLYYTALKKTDAPVIPPNESYHLPLLNPRPSTLLAYLPAYRYHQTFPAFSHQASQAPKTSTQQASTDSACTTLSLKPGT